MQTRRDYTGRALWELLQNADDAMAPAGRPSSELIGLARISHSGEGGWRFERQDERRERRLVVGVSRR